MKKGLILFLFVLLAGSNAYANIKVHDDANEKNDKAAVNTLSAFINAVEGQSGGKIASEKDGSLIVGANAIIGGLQGE